MIDLVLVVACGILAAIGLGIVVGYFWGAVDQ